MECLSAWVVNITKFSFISSANNLVTLANIYRVTLSTLLLDAFEMNITELIWSITFEKI